ncbi:alpha-xylosidase [Humibacter soli]
MKFTDGFWLTRPGVEPLYALEAYDIIAGDRSLTITAPTKVVAHRGDTLNRPVLTVTLSSPLENVIGVRVDHFTGVRDPLRFDLVGAETGHGEAAVTEAGGTLSSGALSATIGRGAPWDLSFSADGRVITSSGHKSISSMRIADGTDLSRGIVGTSPVDAAGHPRRPHNYLNVQLSLGVGELVYGLGERFGPLVKNGQSVDIWNADGGTASEHAYKNVPFYLTNRGYGVLVNDPGHVSYEIGTEAVERVQFSVSGESIEYFIIYGPTPAEILERYTALTGRPASVPAWSYGLWLSTSFTTDYNEATVTSFIDAMAEHDLPLSVFHFDCFWMREFNWCDFEWDARTFPDPKGMLARLHDKDLRVCVWINPYIAQRSPLFAEAAAAGYLVKKPYGDVWQWDLWQAGMGLVDFTNPAATAWFQGHLRRLLDMGVDAFKTDFGERIPLDIDYFDRSSPERMHNYYTQLYNAAVFDLLRDVRGDDSVVFARSATAGGQKMPVHWGGDSTSSFESMAETLRGGLSLALSGFAFWSHDIGGFEGTPDAAVFKRWTAFGLLSSHSRFHGSNSYRVPWAFDADAITGDIDTSEQSAVAVARRFARLKNSLMPYLYAAGVEASVSGAPVMRPMQFEFPDDPAVAYLDRQYMLGRELLVAPVFTEDGSVEFYLPQGTWTEFFTGEQVAGGCWRREVHEFDTLPLYVRPGAVLPIGNRVDRPDYDYLDALVLRDYPGEPEATRDLTVVTPDGSSATFSIVRTGGTSTINVSGDATWSHETIGRHEAVGGAQ